MGKIVCPQVHTGEAKIANAYHLLSFGTANQLYNLLSLSVLNAFDSDHFAIKASSNA